MLNEFISSDTWYIIQAHKKLESQRIEKKGVTEKVTERVTEKVTAKGVGISATAY